MASASGEQSIALPSREQSKSVFQNVWDQAQAIVVCVKSAAALMAYIRGFATSLVSSSITNKKKWVRSPMIIRPGMNCFLAVHHY